MRLTDFMLVQTQLFPTRLRSLGPKVATLLLLMVSAAVIGVQPATAAPALQVAPNAPENLRCSGTPAPALPAPDWRAEPVWAWQDLLHVDGVIGSNDGPYAVALDGQCNSYVADSQHYRILKLTPDGTVVGQWSLPGERAPGESSSPRGVAVDRQGNVYATDTARDRVYKFSSQGQVVGTWGECAGGAAACDAKLPGRFQSPEGIAADGTGNVFIAETAGLRVQKVSDNGQPLAIWDLKGKGLGELFIPGSLSVDQAGSVYLSEGYGNLVLKYNASDGALVGRWGGALGGEPGQLHGPLGVGVDAAGNLYVADSGNWRVQKLGPDGAFLAHWRNCLDGDPPCQFPDAGAEPGQFMAPRGFAVDGQGSVYVADTANKRVERLIIVDWILIAPPEDEG
jgi:DNA-binding beta-propeller fold protein YncE